MAQTNPVKAIRAYCLSCCLESAEEVRQCPADGCELHAFRFGKNPYRAKREYTEEQLAKMRENMANANKAKFAVKSRQVDDGQERNEDG